MQHGTYSKYVHDACRCDDCKTAQREYARGKPRKRSNQEQYKKQHARAEKAKRHALREDVPHGTLDGYTNHACRCWECTEAGSSYARVRAGGSKPKNKTPKYGTKHSTGNGLAAIQKGFVE
jgi:hypothetical protein